MIVAQFTPDTGWAGRSITYDSGQFALDGYGPVTAQAVLQYDQQGQLAWSYDGLREWVTQMAGASVAGAGGPGAGALPQGGYYAPATYAPAIRQPDPPGIAIAGFILAVMGFIIPVIVVWWVGLPLSWVGYKRAVREGLPTGLAMAGLIINAVMTVLSVIGIVILVIAILVAAGSAG